MEKTDLSKEALKDIQAWTLGIDEQTRREILTDIVFTTNQVFKTTGPIGVEGEKGHRGDPGPPGKDNKYVTREEYDYLIDRINTLLDTINEN